MNIEIDKSKIQAAIQQHLAADSPYKWPSLAECYQHVFGHGFEGAHDAQRDVRATAEIFFWLRGRNRELTTQTTLL